MPWDASLFHRPVARENSRILTVGAVKTKDLAGPVDGGSRTVMEVALEAMQKREPARVVVVPTDGMVTGLNGGGRVKLLTIPEQRREKRTPTELGLTK